MRTPTAFTPMDSRSFSESLKNDSNDTYNNKYFRIQKHLLWYATFELMVFEYCIYLTVFLFVPQYTNLSCCYQIYIYKTLAMSPITTYSKESNTHLPHVPEKVGSYEKGLGQTGSSLAPQRLVSLSFLLMRLLKNTCCRWPYLLVWIQCLSSNPQHWNGLGYLLSVKENINFKTTNQFQYE